MEYVISAIWSALELLCVALFNGAFLVKKPERKAMRETPENSV